MISLASLGEARLTVSRIPEVQWAIQHPKCPDWARQMLTEFEKSAPRAEPIGRDEVRLSVHQSRERFYWVGGDQPIGSVEDGSITRSFQDTFFSIDRLEGPVHTNIATSDRGWVKIVRADVSGKTPSYQLTNEGLDSEQSSTPATMAWSTVLEELSPPPHFREVFVTRSGSMEQVRRDYLHQLREGMEDLPAPGRETFLEILASGRSDVPRRLWTAMHQLGVDPDLRQVCADWRSLEDVPSLSSDGMSRTRCHWLPPAVLANSLARAGWEVQGQSGLPIAEVVGVGGGPGGLATCAQLTNRGVKTVLFEGCYLGQSFSDRGAAAVHRLRTGLNESELVRGGLDHPASLFRHRLDLRARSYDGRRNWSELTGAPFEDLSPAQKGGLGVIERNEF